MDLFGDLPPPAGTGTGSAAGGGLFDDLPQASSSASDTATTGLAGGSTKRPAEEAAENPKLKQAATASAAVGGASGEGAGVLFAPVGVAACRRGERDEMQDAHTMIDRFGESFPAERRPTAALSYYGVFDGHAGARAAEHCAARLHHVLVSKFPQKPLTSESNKLVKRTLVETFLATDKEFLAKAAQGSPTWRDGCTAVVCLMIDNHLYAANIGDSRAVLGRVKKDGPGMVPLRLTQDHSPTQFEERQRIQKAGGTVVDGRVNGIMEVSRSIGDGRFKRLGVIATPEVKRCKLTERDRFLLVACDGLWKVFSVEDAVSLTDELLQQQNSKSAELNLQAVANSLVNEAVHRGSTDNVSVVLVGLERREGGD